MFGPVTFAKTTFSWAQSASNKKWPHNLKAIKTVIEFFVSLNVKSVGTAAVREKKLDIGKIDFQPKQNIAVSYGITHSGVCGVS